MINIDEVKIIFDNSDVYKIEEGPNHLKISFEIGELSAQINIDEELAIVSIGSWHEMFEDIESLKNLLNILLNEKCRLEVLSCGGEEYCWELQVLIDNEWRRYSKVRAFKITFFRKVDKKYFNN